MDVESRLAELGIDLPEAPKPVASYIPCVIANGFAFCAGQIPMKEGKPQLTGHVGAEVTEEQANDAARQCALQALAVLRDGLDGDLSRLKRIVKLEVFVAAVPGFTGQPQVANGASELLGQVLGDAGLHARVAVGVTDLPLGVPVEVVVTAEVG